MDQVTRLVVGSNAEGFHQCIVESAINYWHSVLVWQFTRLFRELPPASVKVPPVDVLHCVKYDRINASACFQCEMGAHSLDSFTRATEKYGDKVESVFRF